jgi:hypothetical protein
MSLIPVVATEITTPGRLEQVLIRALAVAGAALVGGLLLGLLGQVAARLVLRRARPGLVKALRLGGGLGMGVIAALFFFGSGPGGFGGGPGWGLFGSGGAGAGLGTGPTQDTGKGRPEAGSPPETLKGDPADRQARAVGETKPNAQTSEGAALRVEVLGDERVEGERFYRLDGGGPLQTLAEVRQHLRQCQKEGHPGQLQVVLYRNSPNEDKQQVMALRAAAQDFGLPVTLEFPPRDAP